jgi:hypothetical protein
VLGSDGGGWPAANSAAADLGTCGKNGDGAGDCGRPVSIPRTGGKRKAWGRFGARRWSRGQRGTAAEGDGRARLPVRESRGEGERVGQRDRERKGRASWRPGAAPGGHLGVEAASRRWRR